MMGRVVLAVVVLLLADLATAGDPGGKPAEEPGEFKLPPLEDSSSADQSIFGRIDSIYVSRVEVHGVTVLEQSEIDAVTRHYAERTLSRSDLHELRAALSQKYVDKEFITSGVVLPDQRVEDGVVTLQAVEGSLTSIELVGDPGISGTYIEGRLRRHIDDPVNVADIRYALQYLQNDPNIQRIDARLIPGEEAGQSILRVAVDEAPRFRAGIGADNFRASSTGAEQATARFSARNVTGYGETFDLAWGISDGADNYSAIFAAPVTRRNTRVQIYGSRSDSSIIEDRFAVLDIDSLTDTWGIGLTHPVVDNLDTTLSFVLGYEDKHSETSLLGLPFSFSPGAQGGVSNTSVAQAALDWTTRGSSHVLALRGNYRKGMDLGDATVYRPATDIEMLMNPTGADGLFDVFQFQALLLKRLNTFSLFANAHDRGQFVFRVQSQISGDPLMSLEKFAIGGVRTVRGYPENLLVRDNGVAATLELQIPLLGYSDTPGPKNLVVVPFLDYGRSWDQVDTDPGNPERNTDEAKYILGLGAGLVWEPLEGLNFQIYWGADIGDNFGPGDDPRTFRDADLQDDGVHISIGYDFTW